MPRPAGPDHLKSPTSEEFRTQIRTQDTASPAGREPTNCGSDEVATGRDGHFQITAKHSYQGLGHPVGISELDFVGRWLVGCRALAVIGHDLPRSLPRAGGVRVAAAAAGQRPARPVGPGVPSRTCPISWQVAVQVQSDRRSGICRGYPLGVRGALRRSPRCIADHRATE